MKLLLAAVLMMAVLAGCLSHDRDDPLADPLTGGYDEVDNPIPGGTGHDHRDASQHRFARHAQLTGFDDLARFGIGPSGVVGAHVLDVSGNLLAVGVNAGEEDGGQQGFHLFDVSDGGLAHVGQYNVDVAVGGDRTIAFSQDGKTVFLGYEGGERPGVAAVDVSDPTAPKEVAFWADPLNYGSHTLTTGTIDGVQYVFSISLGVNILRFDAGQLQLAGKFVTNDELSVLDAPNSQTGTQTFAVRSLYGHDTFFFDDPVTGKPLLFYAAAYDGAKILDLSIPSVPLLQARWMPPADTTHKHYTHSVAAQRMPDGQLLWVVGTETFEPENQNIASPIWVLDATEAVAGLPLLSDPIHLGTWRNPGLAAAGNLGISAHFYRLVDGIVYLAHYHGGVWAIDLRTAEQQKAPTAFGYIMPLPTAPRIPPEECCIGFDLSAVPMVFDVAVGPDGTVYAADIIQGVSAIRFDVPALDA